MQIFSRKSLIILFFLFHLDSFGNDIYEFKDSYQEQRFFSIIDEIRCPKCTSGSLASSNAPVSEDLKKKIFELLEDGYTDQDIRNYVVERFGKDSVYQPKFSENIFLWLAPLVFIIFLLSIFHFVRR